MSEKVFTLLGSSNHYGDRQPEDFYSTPYIATEKLLSKLKELNINLADNIIEPSVGKGGIAIPLMNSEEGKNKNYLFFDIVDRGFPNTIIKDFLSVNNLSEGNYMIFANFPYKDILNHTIHSLSLLKNEEWLFSLAKIQFLETKRRYNDLLKNNPPRYVMVFVERINCPKNDEDNGQSSAICYCWYAFQKGYKGSPEILWLEGPNK